MNNIDLKNMIEEAKEISKEQFIIFTKGIFDIEEDIWNHLWKVPIIASYEGDKILVNSLQEEQLEELLGDIDQCIDNQIGDAEAVFIPFETIKVELEEDNIGTEEEIDEKYANILTQEYDAIIVYNENKLRKIYNSIEKEYIDGPKKKTQDEINQLFKRNVAKIFNHERCHLNANTLICLSEFPNNVTYINGVQLEDEYNGDYENYNEVCIDTLAMMMYYYKPGMDIQDCLYKVIESRNGETRYRDFDDRLVLSLYAIFPEEMTKWTLFEAYDYQHRNIVKEKIKDVFESKVPTKKSELLCQIGLYFNKIHNNQNMIQPQERKSAELLELLGVENIKYFLNNNEKEKKDNNKFIDEKQIKEIAEDEKVIREIPSILHEIKLQKNIFNDKFKEDKDFTK